MSGRLPKDRQGQLSTLDAIVFFSAAMLVSSVILSYGFDAHGVDGVGSGRDPGELLEVFLKASVGKKIVLDLSESTVIEINEQIGECLRIELCSICAGTPENSFVPLNQRLNETLGGLCGPSLFYRLVALDAASVEVIAIGMETGSDMSEADAGSITMRNISGEDYVLVLAVSACYD